MDSMKSTLRSPWSYLGCLVLTGVGLSFTLILFADAPVGSRVGFGLGGLVMLLAAVRAALLRVEVNGRQVTVVGFWGRRSVTAAKARAEAVDDKVVATVWAPVLTADDGSEEAIMFLSGYGSSSRPNKRVVRVCDSLNASLLKEKR